MVAGTFLSAPIMFVSAKMLTVVVNSELDYKTLMLETSFDTSIISLVCSVSTHRYTLFNYVYTSHQWNKVIIKVVVNKIKYGIYSCVFSFIWK